MKRTPRRRNAFSLAAFEQIEDAVNEVIHTVGRERVGVVMDTSSDSVSHEQPPRAQQHARDEPRVRPRDQPAVVPEQVREPALVVTHSRRHAHDPHPLPIQ